MVVKEHYDKKYFEYQKSVGAFSGLVNLVHFRDFCQPHFNVIDFGCGGGYLLSNLNCQGKIGIEVNPSAREEAEAKGITVYPAIDAKIPDGWADPVMSDNALEHTSHPFSEIQNLFPKLKPGGLIVFVVPCESVSFRYEPGDINQHLYSWSPMCLGNLFQQAGYEIISSRSYFHRFPPFYAKIRQLLGARLFDVLCRIYARLYRRVVQVRIVARRPVQGSLSRAKYS